MTDDQALRVEEQALHEQEQGLSQMEAELYTQEQAVDQKERLFQKKNKRLLQLAAYVQEQEAGLLRRAEAMGPKARVLAATLLAEGDGHVAESTLELGHGEARLALLERRRELTTARMEIFEEREALLAQRTEALEHASTDVGLIEARLVTREAEVSAASREVFSAGLSLLTEEAESGEEGDRPKTASFTRPQTIREPTPPSEATASFAAISDDLIATGGEPAPEQKRRNTGRVKSRTNEFKISLEAQLGSDDGHQFFRYADDLVTDTPGFFIATPNLLKIGREVRIRIQANRAALDATGIVAWRRQRGEPGGAPGMGIELLSLSEADHAQITQWLESYPAAVI